jgi:hypothetical protein
MEINETYYHPNLLFYPVLGLLLAGVYVYLGDFQTTPIFVGAFVLFVASLSPLIDAARVRAYVEKKGARLTAMKWAPFAPGWFWSGKNSTAYAIEYADPLGKTTSEQVRVSLWFGVRPVG